MRIMLLNLRFYPAVGGIETYLMYLSRELAKLGHDPFVVCGKHSRGLARNETHDGLPIVRFDLYSRGTFLIPRLVSLIAARFFRSATFRTLCGKPDVIICRDRRLAHAASSTLGTTPLLLIPPAALAYEEFETQAYPWPFGLVHKRVTLRQQRELDQSAVHRADRVAVFSRFMQRELSRNYELEASRINVVHPGVDTARFGGIDKADLRSEMGLSPDAFVLLSVCRLTPGKNLPLALRAMQIIQDKNCHLLIAGDGLSRWQLEQLASELNIQNNCRFLGWRKDVENLYAMADAFVLPSYVESFGHVFLEAMSSAIPVISLDTATVGANEIICEGKTGLRTRDNPEALATLIRSLMDNPELRAKMGQIARKECLNRFSWEKHTERILELIMPLMTPRTSTTF